MNFSDNILANSIVDQWVDVALDLFRDGYADRAN
jgi:hypothetical protein